MLTASPRGQFPRWRHSRKRLSVCSVLRCPDLWLQCSVSFVHGSGLLVARSVITVQREFCARFRTDGSACCNHRSGCATSSSKPYTKLALHCNHRSGHLKTEHTERLFLLRRPLGIWPRDPAVNMRSQLLVVHQKLRQLPLLTVYVVPV
jgi:hypothetical protein